MEAFWYTVAGIVFGGIIAVAVTRHYARKSSKELHEVAEDLRHEVDEVRYYVDALISYLEVAGFRVERTAEGKPSRIIRQTITDKI